MVEKYCLTCSYHNSYTKVGALKQIKGWESQESWETEILLIMSYIWESWVVQTYLSSNSVPTLSIVMCCLFYSRLNEASFLSKINKYNKGPNYTLIRTKLHINIENNGNFVHTTDHAGVLGSFHQTRSKGKFHVCLLKIETVVGSC